MPRQPYMTLPHRRLLLTGFTTRIIPAFNLQPTPNACYTYHLPTTAYDCPFDLTLHCVIEPRGPSPWLPGRFDRPSTYSPWRIGDPRNCLYADIPDTNPYTGKRNLHLFSITTAEEALNEITDHLTLIVKGE